MKFIQSTGNKEFWKKVITISVISVVALIALIFLFLLITKPESPILNLGFSTKYIDKTETLSITLPRKYNLKEENESANHILELSSGENLFIAVSVEGAYLGNSMLDAIVKDRDEFIKNYTGTSNVSDVTQEEINGLKIYTYSFEYKNNLKDYTLETIWIEGPRGLFIVDINYLTEKAEYYTTLHDDIINNLNFM